MKNYFEVCIRYEDEIKRFQFTNYLLAKHKYIELLDNTTIYTIVVISYIEGYAPSIVLVYSNDWNDDFIQIPEWVC